MLQPAFKILTFKAFQPDFMNPNIPYHLRLRNTPLLGINLGKKTAELCRLAIENEEEIKIEEQQIIRYKSPESLIEAVTEFRRKHELVHGVVFVNYGMTVQKSEVRVKEEGRTLWELLRSDAEECTGTEAESGYRYSLIRSPSGSSNLVFSYTENVIEHAEEIAKGAKFIPLQISGSIEVMIALFLQGMASSGEIDQSTDLVILDHASLCVIQLDGRDFGEHLACRSDASDGILKESRAFNSIFERYIRQESQICVIDFSVEQDENALAGPSTMYAYIEEKYGRERTKKLDKIDPYTALLKG